LQAVHAAGVVRFSINPIETGEAKTIFAVFGGLGQEDFRGDVDL